MRKLEAIEHISLDGVIQHSAADDDFPYRDWTAPYRTPAGRDAVMAALGERFDRACSVAQTIERDSLPSNTWNTRCRSTT